MKRASSKPVVELGPVTFGRTAHQRVAPFSKSPAIRLVRGTEDRADHHLWHLEGEAVGNVMPETRR
jgi:hypothetical protein